MSFTKLRVFYVNTAVSHMLSALLNPIFVIYLVNSGITHAQIAVLMALYSSIPALLMIFLSAISDAWSRRKVVICGTCIYAAAYLAMYLASCYEHFLIAVILMGIATAFISTPLNAWMMDEIKEIYGKKMWVEHVSRITKTGEIFSVLTGLSAFVFLFKMSDFANIKHLLRYFWLTACILSILNLFNFIFSTEKFRRKGESIKNSLKKVRQIFKQFLNLLRSSAELRYIALSFVIFATGNSILFVAFFPYLKDMLNITEQFFNLIYLAISLIAIIFYHYNRKLVEKLNGERNVIVIVKVFTIFILASLFFIHTPIISLLILIMIMSVDIGISPVFSSLLNRAILTRVRSTTLSFIIVLASLGGMLGALLYGAVAQLYGLHTVILVVLIFVMLGVIPLLRVKS